MQGNKHKAKLYSSLDRSHYGGLLAVFLRHRSAHCNCLLDASISYTCKNDATNHKRNEKQFSTWKACVDSIAHMKNFAPVSVDALRFPVNCWVLIKTIANYPSALQR